MEKKVDKTEKYKWTEFDYKMKEIWPYYVPIEERSPEEQEEAYDRAFDWDDED